LFLAGPSQPDTQKELGGTVEEFKEMKVNLIQQMYFIFATSFKINNFFFRFIYEKQNTYTLTHKPKTKKLTTNTTMLMK